MEIKYSVRQAYIGSFNDEINHYNHRREYVVLYIL